MKELTKKENILNKRIMIINYLFKSDKISEKMYSKVRNIILSAGMLTLSLGLILPRFFVGYRSVDFISGFFIGISIVLNIVSLLMIRKYRK